MRYLLLTAFAGLFFLSTGFTSLIKPLTEPGISVEEAEAVGVWISNNGKEKFEIYQRDGRYHGRIIWMKEDEQTGAKRYDQNNPDPLLRDRTVVGLEILTDFEYKGDGVYTQGRVYDPGSGNTYKCRIKVEGNTAKVRGYILMPLIGRTETAHRITE